MPSVSTEAEFNEVVNQCYQLWHEQLGADAAFLSMAAQELRAFAERSQIIDFADVVKKLRNGSFHSAAQVLADREFRRAWVGSRQPWSNAAGQAHQSLVLALGALALVSGKVRANDRLKQAWADRASVDPATVFASVARDMAINLPPKVQGMKVDQIARRAKNLGPDEDVHARLQDFAVEELVMRPRQLPVPYHEVLDRLQLLGSRDAKGALLIASGVAQTARLSPIEFLDRVERLWADAR